MKFLIEWEAKPKHRQALLKLLETYKQSEDLKTLFPAHYCVGASRGFSVVEAENTDVLQDGLRQFMDYLSYVVTPIRPLFPKGE